MKQPDSGPLTPYRALDLTDEKGLLCGKLLGDLGADVIKVERPEGDPARRRGPFYGDEPNPERSLYWFAFNTSKRGITLNLELPRGRELLLELATKADFIIESFLPGRLVELGLGYEALRQANPRLILVSITPFGQTGPYRDLKASDLVHMALGGQMYTSGDPDRAPVRLTVPQAYLHAGAHAAVGAMLAHHGRLQTGQGQWVDVSTHACIARLQYIDPPFWAYDKFLNRRSGAFSWRGPFCFQHFWACRDGYVCFRIMGGRFGKGIRKLVEWMDAEGMAGPLKDIDWDTLDVYLGITPEQVKDMEKIFAAFILKHTKAELLDYAVKYRVMLTPLSSPGDLLKDQQLASREFWVDIDHPELNTAITYPGAPFKLSETPWRISRRAPLLGEHNQEVYAEMGLTQSDLDQLRRSHVI